MTWFRIVDKEVILRVYVKPNAKQFAILGIKDDCLQISLAAKPVEGEANKALINGLATYFKLPKSQIKLEKGEQSRYKQLRLPLEMAVKDFIVGNANE